MINTIINELKENNISAYYVNLYGEDVIIVDEGKDLIRAREIVKVYDEYTGGLVVELPMTESHS